MISICNGIHNELLGYTRKESPSLDWTVQEISRITKHYPRGMTRNILLTELEARWRLSLRRGEHSGKLRQAIQTMTMNSTDIYSGVLSKVDEYRYRLSSYDGDNTSVLLLLHRRFADFIAYVNHISAGYPNFFAAKSIASSGSELGRKFLCTKTRLLRSNATAIILPTEYASFEIDTNSKDDIRMLQGPLKELHRQFLRQPSTSDDQLQGCYGIVYEISEIRTYPTARARSYRLVSLQLVTLEGVDQLLLGKDVSSSSSAPLSAGIVFVLLFDDQVHMSNLWSPQDLLYIHRPCVSNNEEEPLFGMNVEVRTSMGGEVVYPVATPIKKHPRREANAVYSPTTSGKQMNSYHLIVGAITCISLVKKREDSNDSNSSDGSNDLRERRSVISLEKSLSPHLMMSIKDFFPTQKISLSLRVLCKELATIRVTTHNSKLKCKKRCVLWCALSTASSVNGFMLFRLICAANQATSVELGHIITVFNAHVMTSFGPNEVPSEVLPKCINMRYNCNADITNVTGGHVQPSLILITVGKPYSQEIQPFLNSMGKESPMLLGKDSMDLVSSGSDTTSNGPHSKHFTNALELTSSSHFQEISGLTNVENCSIVNMSKIASFCNSPSIYPVSTDDIGSNIGTCGCITGNVECFGDIRYLKADLSGILTSIANNNDAIYEAGKKRKLLDGEDVTYVPSMSQSIVGVISLKDRSVSRLCLVGINTLNMATSQVIIDEDTFCIEESQFENPKLAFFVSRVDDVVSLVEETYNSGVEQTTTPNIDCDSSSRKIAGRSNGDIDACSKQLFYDIFDLQRQNNRDCETNRNDHDHRNTGRSNMKLPNVQEMVEIIRNGRGDNMYRGPIYYVESIDICVQGARK